MKFQLRSFRFRIYPSKKQEKLLNTHLWISKNLWNEMLTFTKDIYKNYQKFPTKRTLRELVKNSSLFSQVGQELVDRLIEAVWRKVKKQQKGFPRFKSIDRMKSLVYPQAGFELKKKLKVTPFGGMAIKKHREIKGKIKTLTLKKEASEKWYAIFCAEQGKKQPKINKGEKVGIDLGLLRLATLSNGIVIKNPRHFKKHEERLALYQRKLSKKKKRSKNRRKTRLKVARQYEKMANCRRDFLHKLSTRMVDAYSFIALEELSTQEMAEQNYGKSINDAGWRMVSNMLSYKAEGAGCRVVFVDPKDTSKMCSSCGAIVNKELSERMHNCPLCGLGIDRDLNAAMNILKRATAGQAGSNACGDEAIVSSLKQEAHIL